LIKSDFLTYKNSNDKRIVGVYDHIARSKKNKPFIIIPPAFGETKADSLSMSYFLVMNGFNVLRYDATNHSGESDGDIINFTMEEGRQDLVAGLEFLEKEFGAEEVGVVAKSLGWRVALRAALQDRRINYILGIGGVVDLQKTLKTVYHEDLVDMVLNNTYKSWKLNDIFGFEISRNFLESAIQDDYHTIRNTKSDFNKLTIPTSFLHAENDVWVEVDDMKKIMSKEKYNTCVQIIPHAMHQIDENPLAALTVLRLTVVNCMKYLSGKHRDSDKVIKPDIRSVAKQKRLEKKRLQPYELTKNMEKQFWQKYLVKYSCINKIKDYNEYLDSIVNLLGGIGNGEVVLDAGCGPGYLGAWLLANSKNESHSYVGIDFIMPVLKKARTAHNKLIANISKQEFSGAQDYKLSYICSDLDRSWNSKKSYKICFQDNVYDKVCSSLLVSYLKSPLVFLKECYRIIKPGGKIIVTTLKPYADLSQIYRNFTTQTKSKKDIENARRLLSSAGMIKIKESQGYYRFYSEENLIQLLRRARFRNIKCYRTFGNQINLAVAIK
jgi:ubiquinone/menaquinone biosynthesis C-methylase UbiE/esterase/lipase